MATPTIKSVSIENEWYQVVTSPRIFSISIERVLDEEVYYVGVDGKQIKLYSVSKDRLTGTAVAFKQLISVLQLVGQASVSTLNAASPSYSDAYIMTDSGTLTAGSLSVAAGDLVEWDGSAWAKIKTNSGGYVPSGTRAALSTQTALVSPYTDASDDGKIFEFDGTDNIGFDTENAHEGAALFIEPSGSSVLSSEGYFFSGSTPSGTWIKFSSDQSESIQFTCTATEAVNDLVYISADNTVAQADASDSAKIDVIGWIESKINSTTCMVSTSPGPVTSSSLTAGERIFLSDTPGAVQSGTPGTNSVEVGIAKSSTSFIFTGAKIGIV